MWAGEGGGGGEGFLGTFRDPPEAKFSLFFFGGGVFYVATFLDLPEAKLSWGAYMTTSRYISESCSVKLGIMGTHQHLVATQGFFDNSFYPSLFL